MFAGKRHLDDDVLIRRYLADRGLAALEASDEGAVAAPRPLRGVRGALRIAASGVRRHAPGRGRRRRRRLLTRIAWSISAIASSGASTRCRRPAGAALPRRRPERRTPRVSTACSRRWVAAAAVAGLLVGLGAGRLVFDGDAATTTAARPQAPPPPLRLRRARPTMRALHVEPAVNDDQFLSEIELATAAPRTRELRAIYAFTLEEPRDVPRAVGKD